MLRLVEPGEVTPDALAVGLAVLNGCGRCLCVARRYSPSTTCSGLPDKATSDSGDGGLEPSTSAV